MQKKNSKKSQSLEHIAREISKLVAAPTEDVELALRVYERVRKNPRACLCSDCVAEWLKKRAA